MNTPHYVRLIGVITDTKLKTINDEAILFYKRFHSKLNNHPNELIKNLSTPSIPGKPPRRQLKRGVVIS